MIILLIVAFLNLFVENIEYLYNFYTDRGIPMFTVSKVS